MESILLMGISELFMEAVDDGGAGWIFVLEGEGGAFKGEDAEGHHAVFGQVD